VIIANRDPFEQVDGAGIGILKRAGVKVRTGVLEQEGLWMNRRFFCFHEQRRPYIILKWAQSVEGFIAPEDRSRTQLSNHYSSTLVHRWRTEEAAIMVGYQTALQDNPKLTARNWPGNQPLRIVLDKDLQLPRTHHLFDGEAETWIVNQHQEAAETNLSFIMPDFTQDILPQLLQRLHQQGKLSLIVEGGAALLNAFIEAGLWDEARVFKTPTSISTGIAAPLLHDADLAQETALANDGLQLWVNKNSKFTYPAGMSL
jgi:diaminohydroxyphosphoribosylaminopyrimidine deaminase/5-amino-6-(5-phosphoribosylamino)uracil reductase